MLQETLDNWKIYESSYDQLDRWLNECEQVLRRSSEEKLVSYILLFFSKEYFILEINYINKLYFK